MGRCREGGASHRTGKNSVRGAWITRQGGIPHVRLWLRIQPGADFRSVSTETATASGYRTQRPPNDCFAAVAVCCVANLEGRVLAAEQALPDIETLTRDQPKWSRTLAEGRKWSLQEICAPQVRMRSCSGALARPLSHDDCIGCVDAARVR